MRIDYKIECGVVCQYANGQQSLLNSLLEDIPLSLFLRLQQNQLLYWLHQWMCVYSDAEQREAR